MAGPLPATGAKLLKELKASTWLPQYNDSEVLKLAGEIDELSAKAMGICGLPDFDIEDADWRVAVETYNALGRHARACLSAYLMFRLSRVMELRWEAAATLPEANRAVLSEAERGFADGYDQVLATYMDDLGYGLDLTNGSLPPKDLYVEVRVHRNAGSIVLESGAVLELRANEMHFLRRSDVEPLIRQGLVEHCYQ